MPVSRTEMTRSDRHGPRTRNTWNHWSQTVPFLMSPFWHYLDHLIQHYLSSLSENTSVTTFVIFSSNVLRGRITTRQELAVALLRGWDSAQALRLLECGFLKCFAILSSAIMNPEKRNWREKNVIEFGRLLESLDKDFRTMGGKEAKCSKE